MYFFLLYNSHLLQDFLINDEILPNIFYLYKNNFFWNYSRIVAYGEIYAAGKYYTVPYIYKLNYLFLDFRKKHISSNSPFTNIHKDVIGEKQCRWEREVGRRTGCQTDIQPSTQTTPIPTEIPALCESIELRAIGKPQKTTLSDREQKLPMKDISD